MLPSGLTRVLSPSQKAPVRGTQSPLAVSQRNLSPQPASEVHLTAQDAPSQAKGSQRRGAGSGQAPLPSQEAARVATPRSHEAARHEMAGPTKPSHEARTAPSQARCWHGCPAGAPGQAPRPARGEPVTGMQDPAASGSAQPSHWPSQALLQQTPSAQKPLLHSSGVVHGLPRLPRATHLPAWQKAEGAQSPSPWQEDLQAASAQAKSPQPWGLPSQAPAPSHSKRSILAVGSPAPAQIVGRQGVPRA